MAITFLRGYTVLKEEGLTYEPQITSPAVNPVSDRPFKIVRIDLAVGEKDQQSHERVTIVADHPSRNMAVYWATQLNEGRCTEEKCKEEIGHYK